ncbi:LysR family transcriptional regulator [Ferrimonas marina]|uniref:Transcriptional regulator, LysR family n=1 Tax=Ferrimonas marina TaxID=299255 RepID=A0A1M5XNK8_9GAMM|nr:LysR family transcriptional regulator [Ferrimonas marina]SHI01417.1 transcriptional regulator, LysR family [Ferrimonas marina]
MLEQVRALSTFNLWVFKAVFESGNANLVATELGVSAPTISRSLSQLRLTFQDELFVRRHQGLEATARAKALYPLVCNCTDAMTDLVSSGLATAQQSQDLVLAVNTTMLVPLALRIRQQPYFYPQGDIQLVQWRPGSAERLAKGEIDLGIAVERPDRIDLELTFLGAVARPSLVAAEDHPLWHGFPQLDLNELARFNFTYYRSPGFNDRVDPFEMFCQRKGVTLPKVVCVDDREEWIANLLSLNAFAFAPRQMIPMLSNIPGLRAAALPEQQVRRLFASIPPPQHYLVQRTRAYRRYPPGLADRLVKLVQEFVVPQALPE